MAQSKRSVTLDSDVAAAIEQIAGPGGFSALLNESAKRRLAVERGLRIVDELDAEFGPVSAEALARVDARWPRDRALTSRS